MYILKQIYTQVDYVRSAQAQGHIYILVKTGDFCPCSVVLTTASAFARTPQPRTLAPPLFAFRGLSTFGSMLVYIPYDQAARRFLLDAKLAL